MRYKAKTSPVIRATLAAMRAVDELRDARLEAAANEEERERVRTEYWDVMKPLLTKVNKVNMEGLFIAAEQNLKRLLSAKG